MAELQYNSLPETRKDLGYEWQPISIDAALGRLAKFLERNNAKAFINDVYATNDSVYRNIIIQLPYMNEAFLAEDIGIQFDRDKGRQFTLVRS